MLTQSLRMTARDWRAGELRFLLVALIVAVSALSAVGFFVDRMRAGLNRDAHQLLGADLLINADQPVRQDWRDEAQRRGLLLADTVTFPSMAQAGRGRCLAGPAGLDQGGLARLSAARPAAHHHQSDDASEALGDATAARRRPRARSGSTPTCCRPEGGSAAPSSSATSSFTITQPDRGRTRPRRLVLNFAPRVMLALADLKATGLVDNFARVTYRMQVAAPLANDLASVAGYERWLRAASQADNVKGVRIETLENGRPEMRSTLDRADRFLSLVGLLSAMLAAVAVAMAARRFMQRHLDAVRDAALPGHDPEPGRPAVPDRVRAGRPGRQRAGRAGRLRRAFRAARTDRPPAPTDLPPVSLLPALQGVATGMLLLVGFALPPVLQLRNVPHNRVIRREQAAPQPMALATYGLGVGVFVGAAAVAGGRPEAGAADGRRLPRRLGRVRAGRLALAGGLRRLRGVSSTRAGASPSPRCSAARAPPSCRSCRCAGPDGAAGADRGARRPDGRLAPGHAAGCAEPLHHQHPARPEGGRGTSIRAAGVDGVVLYPMIRGRLVAVNGNGRSRPAPTRKSDARRWPTANSTCPR
jgi:putative ABC transport system permease protein